MAWNMALAPWPFQRLAENDLPRVKGFVTGEFCLLDVDSLIIFQGDIDDRWYFDVRFFAVNESMKVSFCKVSSPFHGIMVWFFAIFEDGKTYDELHSDDPPCEPFITSSRHSFDRPGTVGERRSGRTWHLDLWGEPVMEFAALFHMSVTKRWFDNLTSFRKVGAKPHEV